MSEVVTETVRRRPKDRKQRIEAAAAEAFSAHGFHAVGMEDIAAAVGVSAPALYRHYPSKYALFVACARGLAAGLLDGIDQVPASDDPDDRLDALVAAVLKVTVANRSTGGLYRWEGRYLAPEHRAEIGEQFDRLTATIADALLEVRGDLQPVVADRVASGALAVIASITAHRTSLGVRRMDRVLGGAAHRVLRVSLDGVEAPTIERTDQEPIGGRRELLLSKAITLFNRRGYHDVGIDEIATAAGLTPSGVYRHFSGKSDILYAACIRAAERLTQVTADATARAGSDPAGALQSMGRAYIRFAFEQHELLSVYSADATSLPEQDLARLLALQREHVAEWVNRLRAVHPSLDLPSARILVHAALGVVVDGGRRSHWSDDPAVVRCVAAMVDAVLDPPDTDLGR